MKRWRFLRTAALLFIALITLLLASQASVKSIPIRSLGESGSHAHQQVDLDATIANCRYGTTPAVDDMGEKTAVVSQLSAGWYLTFGVYGPYPPPTNDADFVHMIKVWQQKEGFDYLPGYYTDPPLNSKLKNYIRANPGDIWIFGNEIERGPNPGEDDPYQRGQGDIFADEYAAAYRDFYHFLKDADPTAQAAVSALVEVTPGRLQYLDQVWDSYLQKFGQPMPVDIWTMHVYILPEVQADGVTPNAIANVALGTDPSLGRRESGDNKNICKDLDVYCFAEHDDIDAFAEQVVAMRQWMADHGQKEKPLLLSEYSILYPYEDDGETCFIQDEFDQCFTPDRIYNFMTKTFSYLNNEAKDPSIGYSLDNNRLVQQLIWYTVYSEGLAASSSLVESDLVTLTPLGENFKSHATGEQPSQNLLIEQVADVVAVASKEGTATAKLSVTFRNNGNRKIDKPFKVTFYEDEGLSKPIGEKTITKDIWGCSSRPYVSTVKWPGLSEGTYNYWVKIDSEDTIDEQPGDGDNVGFGRVLIVENGVFLPIVRGNN